MTDQRITTQRTTDRRLQYLRILGMIEGGSLLVLMFIAMPIKWMAGYPEPVRILGTAHGILFLMFVYTLISLGIERSWQWKEIILGVLYASVPFGSFWFDRRILQNKFSKYKG